jgi:hypothetical protein
MIAVRRIPRAVAALLLVMSCLPSAATRPTAAEPGVYLMVTSSDGHPGLMKEPALRPGVLYIGVPFPPAFPGRPELLDGGLPDGGSTVPVAPASVCIPGDCNPPNLFKGDPAQALRVDVARAQLPGGGEGISLTIVH